MLSLVAGKAEEPGALVTENFFSGWIPLSEQ
jgi:hypothetical protein